MSRRGWALFLTLSVLWGLPYFLIRIAVRELDPATLVFARTLPAAVILVPLALFQRGFGTLRGAWRWLVAYSIIEFGVPWLLMGSAERHLTSSVTGLLVACVPLVAVVLSRVLHPDDPVSSRRVLGLGIGTVGVACLVGFDFTSGSAIWLLAMLVVILGYATGPQIISLRLGHASGTAVVAASVAVVATIYAPWGLTHWPAHASSETLAAVAALSLFCTIAAFLVFFQLIKEVGPSRTVVITYFNTGIAVLLGTVGLHEPLTTGIIAGFPMIIAGSILATSAPASVRDSAKSGAEGARDLDELAPELGDLGLGEGPVGGA
jgi:drug/metabolite transporter (DMT)-like permease